MKEKFVELLEYNQYMNLEVIALIDAHYTKVSEKTLLLISHIINAHQIWNSRIIQRDEFLVWQLNDWAAIAKLNNSNYADTKEILCSEDLNSVVSYKNSRGIVFENKLDDIIFHIINHSTYHRAQIATECRNCGINPLISDYIMYKR